MECFTDRKDFRLWNIDSPCVCGVEANNVSNIKKNYFQIPRNLYGSFSQTRTFFPNQVIFPKLGNFYLNSYFWTRVCVSTWQSPGHPGRWRKRNQVYNVHRLVQLRVGSFYVFWFGCALSLASFYQHLIQMI